MCSKSASKYLNIIFYLDHFLIYHEVSNMNTAIKQKHAQYKVCKIEKEI